MADLLTPTEAALHLGITKELLFAYVRYPVKKHLGNPRTLNTEIREGQNYFLIKELIDFDNFLKEPWSINGNARPSIPTFIQDYLKIENSGKCPISAKGYPLENAHIDPYHQSLNHHHHNLIRISKEEHTKIDTGVIPREVLRHTKQKLVDNIKNQLRSEIDSTTNSDNPPKPHPTFIGRTAELIELIEAMEYSNFVVIQGIGGIGKTQLLLNAISSVKYHNPLLWIDTEAISAVRDLEVMIKNALSNHFPNSNGSIIQIIQDSPVTLILDSLENLIISNRDELEDFLYNILSNTNTQFLITTQVDLSLLDLPKKVINLGGLDNLQCMFLLNELLQEQTLTDSEFEWVAEFSGGHPLCVKLITSIIQFHRSVSRTISQLKVVGLPEQPLRKSHNKTTSIDICLSTVYSVLSTEQIVLLQYLKFFPAGLKLPWAEKHFSNLDFNTDISVLRHFFFLELYTDSQEFERIKVLNPVRPFIKKMAEKNKIEAEEDSLFEAISSIMVEAVIIDTKYIENGVYGTPAYGIKRIENELPNILEAFTISRNKALFHKKNDDKIQEEKFIQVIAGIASALGKFCWARGFFEYGSMFAEAGIQANRKLNNLETVAIQYMYLAQIYSRRGDKRKFSETVEELKKLAEETGSVDVKIKYAWSKGRILFDETKFDEALEFFSRAVRLLQDQIKKLSESEATDDATDYDGISEKEMSLVNHLGNLSLLISEVGKVHEFSGNYAEAVKHYEKSIEIHSNFNDETNLLSCYYHYANCLHELNDKEKAISYYLKAAIGFKEHGQDEYLLNAFASIGIFIEEHQSILTQMCFDEETFERVLNSLGIQIQYALRISGEQDINSLEYITPLLVGQLTCVTKMFSFSSFGMMLTVWITDFYTNLELRESKFGYVIAIINLGHAVGGVSEWRVKEESRERMIATILMSCLVINGGPDLKSKTRIFYWLEAWMKFTLLDKEATAQKLWDQAWAIFEN